MTENSVPPSSAAASLQNLKDTLENLTIDGSMNGRTSKFELPDEVERLVTKLSEFHTQNLAMESLHTVASQSPLKDASPLKSSSTALRNYSRALKDFQESQMSNLAASLFNVEEETTEDLVGKQLALNDALRTRDDFSLAKMKQWYNMLSSKPKGQVESHVFSCPIELVDTEITFLVKYLQGAGIECGARWSKPIDAGSTLQCLAFCLTGFFAIETIKPYRNMYDSQLAQVLLTWALQRCGIPLLPQLHQTPAEKVEYVFAIEATRKNICFAQTGHASHLDWHVLLDRPDLLSPLLALLVNRLSSAIDGLGLVVESKDSLAMEAIEAHAVRKARELQVAEGTCIICLDGSPNIATLCCGRTVHMNCIAQWLQNNSTCPQCRKDFPSFRGSMKDAQSTTQFGRNDSFQDESMVGEFLSYLANEPTYDSSSSSSSSSSLSTSLSSSSSSSTSTSTSGTSGLSRAFQYRIHYGSTDEDNSHNENTLDSDEHHVAADLVNLYFSYDGARQASLLPEPSRPDLIDRIDDDFSSTDTVQRPLRRDDLLPARHPWIESAVDDFSEHYNSVTSSQDGGEEEDFVQPGNFHLSFLEPSLLSMMANQRNATSIIRTDQNDTDRAVVEGSTRVLFSSSDDSSASDAEHGTSSRSSISLHSPPVPRTHRGNHHLTSNLRTRSDGQRLSQWSNMGSGGTLDIVDVEEEILPITDDEALDEDLSEGDFCRQAGCYSRVAKDCSNRLCRGCCQLSSRTCALHATID